MADIMEVEVRRFEYTKALLQNGFPFQQMSISQLVSAVDRILLEEHKLIEANRLSTRCVYTENGLCSCTEPSLYSKKCNGDSWTTPKCKFHTTKQQLVDRRIGEFSAVREDIKGLDASGNETILCRKGSNTDCDGRPMCS